MIMKQISYQPRADTDPLSNEEMESHFRLTMWRLRQSVHQEGRQKLDHGSEAMSPPLHDEQGFDIMGIETDEEQKASPNVFTPKGINLLAQELDSSTSPVIFSLNVGEDNSAMGQRSSLV